MELFDVAGPATKRRSGEAAEDEQERPVASQVAKRDRGRVVEPSGCEIGQQVADGQSVGATVPDEGRDDDLALVGAQLLDVDAVARIEGRQAWVVRRRHRPEPCHTHSPREPQGRRRCNDCVARHASTHRAPFGLLLVAALCAAPAPAGQAAPTAAVECEGTLPTRTARSGPVPSTAAFDYGSGFLRVQLGWPKGHLAAGILPDGGSRATVEQDGSIHTKLGWWRGVSGRLSITGRRLDGWAAPLEAHVPAGYGRRGFQPTGLVFPTVGCWRVVGKVGDVRLAFVVRVTKLRWH